MIKEWKAVLVYIAELEKDIPTIRHYAKEIALEDKTKYRILWKIEKNLYRKTIEGGYRERN